MLKDNLSKMLKHITKTIIGSFGLLCACGSAYAASAIAPHQAVYDFHLKSASSAAEVNTIQGKSHYTLTKVCDGWVSSENYAISFGFEQGQNSNFISHYKTWESEDGHSFTFEIVENSTVGGEESHEGFAQKTNTGAEAFFANSAGDMKNLPDDIVFPVEHLRSILQKAGDKSPVISQAHMFFGGEETDALYFISALVGNAKQGLPKEELAQTMGDLAQGKYWPLSIAYYKPDAQDAEPEYAITFKLQPNGIIREYIVDYGSFRMQAKLTKLMPVAEQTCAN